MNRSDRAISPYGVTNRPLAPADRTGGRGLHVHGRCSALSVRTTGVAGWPTPGGSRRQRRLTPGSRSFAPRSPNSNGASSARLRTWKPRTQRHHCGGGSGPGSPNWRRLWKNGGSTRTRSPPKCPRLRRPSPDLATALDRLPLLAERLQDLPQPELRALFESLQLQIAFQPQTRTIDVEVTLVADEPPDRDGETSQVWSVPPAGIEPATRGLGNRCSIH
jgi:hypothetical protein